MSSPRSPYKDFAMSGHMVTNQAARHPRRIAPCSASPAAYWHHVWNMAPRGSVRNSAELAVCRKCHQPKFSSDGKPCLPALKT